MIKSTRDRILQTLLAHPRTTINEMAQTVGINGISVRHHLTSLQADGLVNADEERHGVGRPRLVYFLTEKGLERFPTGYLRLTTRLLDEIKSSLPAPLVAKLFSDMATDLAKDYTDQIQDLTMEERLELIKTLLGQEGFTVEWEKAGENYHIHEISCPYYHVGQSHPEVCTVDQTLISTMLSIPAEKIHCVLRGDAHCTYVIPNVAAKEKSS
ncbi:MAG TPA: winged helix-turn-helix transcriptional regulator [Anaerolineaceae bacterium]|nr:winged helix-turn-helix transcriptional regulator [Anaerolineaceae bacterium]